MNQHATIQLIRFIAYVSALAMPRGVKKEHLPSKICLICDRPFTWRKKWEKVWDEVTTCSKSCNRQRKQKKQTIAEPIVLENQHTMLHDFSHPFHNRSLPSSLPIENGTGTDSECSSTGKTTFPVNYLEKSEEVELSSGEHQDLQMDPNLARKLRKKEKKLEKRMKRQGEIVEHGQKTCDICQKSVDLLIRCRIDATREWKMVCGKCWHGVSGGVVDGDDQHPYYQYGGLWKNRRRK